MTFDAEIWLNSMRTLLEKSRRAGHEFHFYGPAADHAIGITQRSLGLPFPSSYAVFLRNFGGGGIPGGEISGISDSRNPLVGFAHEVYEDTRYFRQQHDLPRHLIVVKRDDDLRLVWCIDTSSPGLDGESPMVNYELDGGTVTHLFDSFASFFQFYVQRK